MDLYFPPDAGIVLRRISSCPASGTSGRGRGVRKAFDCAGNEHIGGFGVGHDCPTMGKEEKKPCKQKAAHGL